MSKLNEAKLILSDPSKWTQNYFARDADNNQTNVNSNHASCFCATGVLYYLYKVSPEENFFMRPADKNAELFDDLMLLDRASSRMGYYTAVDLNDDSDYWTVLKLYDAAINLLEKGKSDG